MMEQKRMNGIFVMNRAILIGIFFVCYLGQASADDLLKSFTENKSFSRIMTALTVKNESFSSEKSYAIQNYTDGALIPEKTRRGFHRVFKEYPLLKFQGYKFDENINIPDIYGYIVFERELTEESKNVYYVHFGQIDTVTIQWYHVKNNLKTKKGAGKYLWFDSERLMMKLCNAAYEKKSLYAKKKNE